MRVSRVEAEQHRRKVIEAASRLFREHGFDGIGLKDLMAGAGLTQGAFYKQFKSKDDLTVQASERALQNALCRWSTAAASKPEAPLSAVVGFYLSQEHCSEKQDGCPVVALGSDAARHGPEVRASFEAGIKAYLKMLDGWIGGADRKERDNKAMAALSTMVGAVLLARAVNDEKMSKQILDAAGGSVMAQVSTAAGSGEPRY